MELGRAARQAGFRLTFFGEAGSTNDLALAAAGEADVGHHWFVAGRQTAGRGRQGRAWESPAGNLHATLLLVAPCAAADAPKLGFVAGVALHAAVRDVAPGVAGLALKWPNDLLADGAKLAGILLEGRMLPGGRQAVAIGIGVNLAVEPDGLPYPTTSLARLGARTTPDVLFASLSDRLAEALALFDEGRGFAAIRARWSAAALPSGAPLEVRRAAGPLAGIFKGLDDDGRLLLDAAGTLHRIEAGDVHLRSTADAARQAAGS
jgi:BirA family biotin operon repressor/biotin-[acetyl-CoA-carboxylase] ligase